jgi:ABC-2 type transport system permease protein
MSEARTAGAIYDLGYQRYAGTRHGRAYAMRTLTTYSLRAAFGLGRGEAAKRLPALVGILVFMPALIVIGVSSIAGTTQNIHYADFLEFTTFLLALFAAGQAPELVVADRQLGVLSLYLARPNRSTDYAIAKLIALFLAMLVLTLGPQLVLFAGKILIAKEPWPAFTAEWMKLFPMVGGSLLVALFISAVGLALSSLTTRRGYATAAVISFFLLTAGLSQIVQVIGFGGIERYAVLGNPQLLISGFSKWLFEIEARRYTAIGRAALPGADYLWTLVISTSLAIALFLHRYRKMDA